MPFTIACEGHFSDTLRSDEQIEEALSWIASGAIVRPELEIDEVDGGLGIHIGCLRVQGEAISSIAGWLVSVIPAEGEDRTVVCTEQESEEFVQGLLLCGCPESVNKAAILTQSGMCQCQLDRI